MKRHRLAVGLLLAGTFLGAFALYYDQFLMSDPRRIPESLFGRFLPCEPASSYLENSTGVLPSIDLEPGLPLADVELRNVNRFIAHAGGAVNGARYTNSLEALEESYQSGFRLFELDIMETADSEYVAAHDWESWKKGTAYEGEIPPSRKVFKEHKLRGGNTPLDMEDINAWFESHPDAILVTDKVNRPRDFSSEFVDKDRLMMELFSLDAVEEGIRSEIRSSMLNWSLLDKLGCDKIEELQKLGVTDIAASRKILPEQADLLRLLKTAGIRVYAFHLNSESWDDEVHVVCREMDYFYGIYADRWDFESVPACPELP